MRFADLDARFTKQAGGRKWPQPQEGRERGRGRGVAARGRGGASLMPGGHQSGQKCKALGGKGGPLVAELSPRAQGSVSELERSWLGHGA